MPVSIKRRRIYAAMKCKHKAVDEFALIQEYFVTDGDLPGVTVGIGDDGAVLQPDAGREQVVVVDTLVAGTHFPLETDPFDIAYRAVAVNLSDVAAMGATPRWMTLALTIPQANAHWLERFAEGLRAAASPFGVSLVGGDTTSGASAVVTVQIMAEVAPGQAILRSGAMPGDGIFVSGTVGDAAAGLELIAAGKPEAFLASRFLQPQARVELGQALSGLATAAIDISDGLYADLGKLLAASNAGAVIELADLPLSAALQKRFDGEAQRRFALSGGDDYELCFTLPAECAMPANATPITRIGEVVAGTGIECHLQGALVAFDDSGYRHFQ
jgi:thiamine-monophosphate kinase